ncbi:hypothetical protein GXP70_18215 [Paenibacillus lycopersici]|uniref:DNA polymerase III beta sliding clamp C-terminal domain-containing protein n=1 Tax=Paenibacillus lycopersici TaxID=2704462 RepID=A0A6C0FXB7_9BACL|nr:hypothetical protein [Paenibacillus lycopersici]QHT61718.1 hypothetical protein GXP70_18215 [Paenibacillus lycopersici]
MSKTLSKVDILSKFGKLFAYTGESRPILQGIHYGTNGIAFVTNAHFALRVSGMHNFQQPVTLNAKTGQPIEGVYPDLSRIFPTDFLEEFEISQAEVPEALLAAQCTAAVAVRLSKKVPTARLEIDDGIIYLSVDSQYPDLTLSAKIGDAPVKSKSLRTFNAEYFSTALAVFEAANTAVTLRLRGPNDPIVLSSDTGIDVLILPYRVSS